MPEHEIRCETGNSWRIQTCSGKDFRYRKKQTDKDKQIGQANLDPARGEAQNLEKQYWQQNNKKRPE